MSRDRYEKHRNVILNVALKASPEICQKLWKVKNALEPHRLDKDTARTLFLEVYEELRAENTPESIELAEELVKAKEI